MQQRKMWSGVPTHACTHATSTRTHPLFSLITTTASCLSSKGNSSESTSANLRTWATWIRAPTQKDPEAGIVRFCLSLCGVLRRYTYQANMQNASRCSLSLHNMQPWWVRCALYAIRPSLYAICCYIRYCVCTVYRYCPYTCTLYVYTIYYIRP